MNYSNADKEMNAVNSIEVYFTLQRVSYINVQSVPIQ